VASTILLLVLVWAVTVPVVLGMAKLLGHWSGPRVLDEAEVQAGMRPTGNVVALVARPQNTLVPPPPDELRQAS